MQFLQYQHVAMRMMQNILCIILSPLHNLLKELRDSWFVTRHLLLYCNDSDALEVAHLEGQLIVPVTMYK